MTLTAIYTRVSTEEQSREGVSLAHQESKCRAQASVHDWEVVGHYQDAGKSAKSLKRDGIQELIELVRNKEVDAVIIYKLDRITRSISDLDFLIQLFNKKGVALVSVQDAIDTSTASGRLVLHLLGTVSQWEREQISERVSHALQFKKEQSEKYCGITPYGFNIQGDKLIEDTYEQEIISQIHSFKESGYSFQRIANCLNNQGVETRLGGEWKKSSVYAIYQRTLSQVA